MPNDSISVPPVVATTAAATAVDSNATSPVASVDSVPTRADSSTRAASTAATNARPEVPATNGTRRPAAADADIRARLDRIKAAIADPDVDVPTGETIIRNVRLLMRSLTTKADSVEATYYLIETNLIIDRPGEACRLLRGVRSRAQGTSFESPLERYLASTALGCDSR